MTIKEELEANGKLIIVKYDYTCTVKFVGDGHYKHIGLFIDENEGYIRLYETVKSVLWANVCLTEECHS